MRRRAPDFLTARNEPGLTPAKEPLEQILGLLLARGWNQFLRYRKPRLRRRVERHLLGLQGQTIGEYAHSLSRDLEEIDALARELLLTSTRFFRDAPAWATLRETVVAPLVRDREAPASIRVWVPGCSTGEEAYSVAMLLTEEMEAQNRSLEARIFASDVSEHALARGRGGVFDASCVAGLSSDRRERFFVREHDVYRVAQGLREMIVFARHDLVRDPPFSRVDLVVCRNLLVDLESSVRHRLIRLLRYSLLDRGALHGAG